MGKRAHERINTIVAARFFCDNLYYSFCYGTIKNISENGMRIETSKCLPFGAKTELLIYDKAEVLHVHVRVRRIIKESIYDAMGIEILNPSQDYLEFVEGLKSD